VLYVIGEEVVHLQFVDYFGCSKTKHLSETPSFG